MKKLIKRLSVAVCVLSLALCSASCSKPDTVSFVPDNLGDNDFAHNSEYKLVWHDEFEGDKLNEDDWGYEIGFIRNNEPQYYTNSEKNVFVKDGALTIRCIKEKFTDSEGKTADYTSGSINTLGKHSFKYGAIEMRAKLPNAETSPKATWPAFWMMGTESYWPYSGETDIMEMYGQNFKKYEANTHWADETDENGEHYRNLWKTQGSVPTIYNMEPLGNDWHTYGIEWDENKMRFYFDNLTAGEVDITDAQMSELHNENYILMGMALQPEIAGDATDDNFPIDYQIDYVRVYQKK